MMKETREEGMKLSKRAKVKATPIPTVEATREFSLAVRGKACIFVVMLRSLLFVAFLIKASFMACT